MDIKELLNEVVRIRELAIKKAYKLREEIVKVRDEKLKDIVVGSVDGGLLKKSYHPFDLVVVSSLGVIYEYKDGNFKVSYYPSKIPKKETELYIGNEFKFFSNLIRVKKELETALDVINRFEVDAMILDGSIVPHPSLRPNSNSQLFGMYQEIINMYEKLYSTCRGRCILSGIVKDSKSSHYFNGLRDTFLLSFVMKGGEKTKSFKYQETNISDIENSKEIFSFYIRPNDKSRPVRVDFLGIENEERIASLIYNLSKFSSVGLPNVILECDKRVKLRDVDLIRIEKKIMSRFPRNFFLRRNGNIL